MEEWKVFGRQGGLGVLVCSAVYNTVYLLLKNAARHGHAETVQLLLAVPYININIQDQRGKSALMWSAIRGRTATVQLLLAAPDIDVNLQDEHGMSSLMWAALKGITEIVQLLLAVTDIKVHIEAQHGMSALTVAAFKGHKAIVQLLLAVPEIDDQVLSRALAGAAEKNHTEIVELIEKEMRWARRRHFATFLSGTYGKMNASAKDKQTPIRALDRVLTVPE